MSIGVWISDISGGLAILAGFAAIVRWLLHNAIQPIVDKVAQHDEQIKTATDLASSTNIKVSRIEGFLAGQGSSKLPAVEPTVETPTNGGIVSTPLQDYKPND